jgi:oxygen-independent coproporphyrinogen III oxidase
MDHDILKSISLYVHVPFCARKCHYCDFYSVPYSESAGDDYVCALLVEWELMKEKYNLADVPVETLYFGGGTPTILSVRQWQTIVERLVGTLHFSSGYEWSVECNPDSFSAGKASLWLDSGVTRLSIGIQSFNDRELCLLGRLHDARQAADLLNHPVLPEFMSVGIDLMYGIPGQTPASLRASLERALDYKVVRHLSMYELTIGDQTDFGRRRGSLSLPPEEALAAMDELIAQTTAENGFEHYEISNFCLPGHACRHNEAYWRHKPYVGLGPSAHSYLPPRRFSNINLLNAYSDKLSGRQLPEGFSATLDARTLSRETVFLGLRTNRGVSEEAFRSIAGCDFASGARAAVLDGLVRGGMMEHDPPFWRLTRKGMLFADAIARDLPE